MISDNQKVKFMDLKVNKIVINNDATILVSNVSEGLIPIKPICEALGIDYTSEYAKIQKNVIYSPAVGLRTMVEANNEKKEMRCIHFNFFAGWLFSIDPANIKDEAKDDFINLQIKINNAVFEHFYGRLLYQLARNEREIDLLEEIETLKHNIKSSENDLNERIEQLERIRKTRLDATFNMI